MYAGTVKAQTYAYPKRDAACAGLRSIKANTRMKRVRCSSAGDASQQCSCERKERSMDIRKLLESHKEIDDRIELCLEEIARLRSLAEKVTSCISPDASRGKGGHSDRVGNYAVKIAELEIQTDKEIDRLVELREKILKIWNIKEIIILFYF